MSNALPFVNGPGIMSEGPAVAERPAERSDSFIDDDADFVKLFVGQASSAVKDDAHKI